MSQHIIKYNNILSIILASLAVAIALTGCRDDLIYENVEIPDAEVELIGDVIFKPLVPINIQTRADAPAGEKYEGIKSLYVFFFDENKELKFKDYFSKDASDPDHRLSIKPAETSDSHAHASFQMKVQAGKYYVYAVANISADQKTDLEKVTTIEGLRYFKLDWDDAIEKDVEMFGVFNQKNEYTPDNTGFENDVLLTINPTNKIIHSWVRRAVSKVTIDFNGAQLKDGVSVYIKKATLKDVASGSYLGTKSKVTFNKDEEGAIAQDNDNNELKDFYFFDSEYTLIYGTSDQDDRAKVTRTSTFTPQSVWGADAESFNDNFHHDNAKALPCYENLQGDGPEKSKWQDSDEDGIIDSQTKDGKNYGTYLEVEGYYVANRPEYKSQGPIKYRFMLGNNAKDNFDVMRNHHYKITMNFKGYGNDVDWHIVYQEKYLEVSHPEDVNYQGKFFKPDPHYSTDPSVNDGVPNAGHTFDDKNVITVTSFATPEEGSTDYTWYEPTVSYINYSHNDETGEWIPEAETAQIPGWLNLTVGDESQDHTKKDYTFVANPGEYISKTINNMFPSTTKGTETAPHNLSNENGGTAVENTANSYIVGEGGWYCFPLVYGNAITEKATNYNAYASKNIVNHLGNNISEPYIIDNEGITLTDAQGKKLSNISVKLIWQDAENLVNPDEISYDPNLFNGKGGIKFHISSIKEGNAVIALIDNNVAPKKDSEGKDWEDVYINIDRGKYGKSGSTKAIWSWHIWATRFGSKDFEKNITILNHKEKPFDLFPVHLGWCAGNKEIRYYKRRKCDIKFKVGGNEIIRTIEQYPHFLLPRGDHPYYQWGRKDPFVATNAAWSNKPRWIPGLKCESGAEYNPPRLFNEPEKEGTTAIDYTRDNRKTTQECLYILVQNPDKWHNAPRFPNTVSDPNHDDGFHSINKSYEDLWSDNNGNKTVYDPCPPGYQVGDETVFTGFTSSGIKQETGIYWFDVLEKNMQKDYYTDFKTINSQVLELYTDRRKIQAITFPVTGYRDYDNKASVTDYPNLTNDPKTHATGIGFTWTTKREDDTKSRHLKFQRSDLKTQDENEWKTRGVILAPFESFYDTDGFAVRPVKIPTGSAPNYANGGRWGF